MDSKKAAFQGSRAPRFDSSRPITGPIGPGNYEVDEVTRLSTAARKRPTSRLGTGVRKSARFPLANAQTPPVGTYSHLSFTDIISRKQISTRELLNSRSGKSGLDDEVNRMSDNIPGPGAYDVNYAIGRTVATNTRYSLSKSERIKWRDDRNTPQLVELKKLLTEKDLFTDKKACRRMAHLALYYPSGSLYDQFKYINRQM
ncbi:hypothetical protein HDU85_004281 [Gaertneriomyces sp. JEL0708]|nr:hypothetical protein HDU85_004281 [Gaertneriomyces sp. JEL0708]